MYKRQGRFIPRDPTGTNQYADGPNLYQYVGSNPAVRVDPQGLVSCSVRYRVFGLRIGSKLGDIQENVYITQSGGLRIRLHLRNVPSSKPKCCDCDSFRWIQVIMTNRPLGGAASPYVDLQASDDPPGHDEPFYYTAAEFPGVVDTNNAEIFSDAPRRSPTDIGAEWEARICLMCVRSRKKDKLLRCLKYGFKIEGTTTAPRVSLKPLKCHTSLSGTWRNAMTDYDYGY